MIWDEDEKRLIRNEGCVTHLYLDSEGNVTAGVGHLIPDEDALMSLPSFYQGTQVVSLEKLTLAYRAVKAAPRGLIASAYRKYCPYDLTLAGVKKLLSEDRATVAAGLSKWIPNYFTFPAAVRSALVDMAFNLGVGGLLLYKKLLAALAREDWDAAAAECHRRGISEARNEETAALFKQREEVTA